MPVLRCIRRWQSPRWIPNADDACLQGSRASRYQRVERLKMPMTFSKACWTSAPTSPTAAPKTPEAFSRALVTVNISTNPRHASTNVSTRLTPAAIRVRTARISASILSIACSSLVAMGTSVRLPCRAGVAKLAYAPDLGSGVFGRRGSSPLSRTRNRIRNDVEASHSPTL
jgi:hypothetical protein